MDSLNDILGRKDFTEPPEMAAIQAYVQREFQVSAGVLVRERDIIITVPNAALANTLRLRGRALRQACQTDKRLVFRINS
jgi:hypothetical protein